MTPTHPKEENNLSSKGNSISLALQNPNHNLIKIRNWNTDLRFEEEQLFFLKLFKKQFLNLEIWVPGTHDVTFYKFAFFSFILEGKWYFLLLLLNQICFF